MHTIDVIKRGEVVGQESADVYVGHPADRENRLVLQIGGVRYDLTVMAEDFRENLAKLEALRK